ncbi:hypothetical protein BASA81_008377 [Batrachochytrium salamandrivorans]|nr:hypothetical protein BASA81_008377 [Batrachochytrium salamandrivorans]
MLSGVKVSSADGPVEFTVGQYMSRRELGEDHKRAVVLEILKNRNMTRRQLERESNLKLHHRYFSNRGTIPFREMNYWLRGRKTETGEFVCDRLYEWAISQQQQQHCHTHQQGRGESAPVVFTPEKLVSRQPLPHTLFRQKRTKVVEEEEEEIVPEVPVDSQEEVAPPTEGCSQVSEIYIPESQEVFCDSQSSTKFELGLGEAIEGERLEFSTQ